MAADTSSGGGLSQLETHYKTFIVSFLFASQVIAKDSNRLPD